MKRMKPYFEAKGVTLYQGDCRDTLKSLAGSSFDSVVTDPPYELGFMGKGWDRSGIAYDLDVWRECLRVLKPGAHLLAFGGSRTYHRLACAIEDAGFEIRDDIDFWYDANPIFAEFYESLNEAQKSQLHQSSGASHLSWVYGSGFPKSLSVAKAIDVESRYGKSKCGCVDVGNVGASGNGIGCQDRGDVRVQRITGQQEAPLSGDTLLSVNARPGDNSVCELRQAGNSQGSRSSPLEESLLHNGVRGGGTKTARLGNASLWAGMEESPSGDPKARPAVSSVWEDPERERTRAACTPPEALPLWWNESPNELGGTLRSLSPQDRSDNGTSFIRDPNRSAPREVILDDQCGWGSALAYVCSWCGQPDAEWLTQITALGTALKPAHEPIVLARKPLVGTVAQNILEHGTGGLNIAGCRIETGDVLSIGSNNRSNGTINFGMKDVPEAQEQNALGRWPANLIHDGSEEVLAGFPNVTSGGGVKTPIGSKPYGSERTWNTSTTAGKGQRAIGGDSGSAARFFYCAKASKRDRNEGLESLPERPAGALKSGDGGWRNEEARGRQPRHDTQHTSRNFHPTVKPTELMRYLCRLITPPGGTVLDLFGGSGSTAKAARLEGFNCVLIEKEPEYCELARQRAVEGQESLNFEAVA